MNRYLVFSIYARLRHSLAVLAGDERGLALPIVLGVLFLGSVVVTPFLVHASSNMISSQDYTQLMSETHSANAGVEQAIWNLTYSNLASQIPDQGDFSGYSLANQVNGFNPGITVTNGGVSGGASINYHIQSVAGSIIIVASVNINNKTATVLSWQFANASGNNPIAATISISPANKNAGDGQFTLTVNGTGFMPGSIVQFAGAARTTNFVSTSQLTAVIPSTDLSANGNYSTIYSITVTNPAPGGGTSNAQIFTLFDPTKLSRIAVSPSSSSLTVGGSQTFTSQGYDQNNNPVSITPTWSIGIYQSTAGSINSGTGVFTAGHTAGAYSNAIVATSGSVNGSASVTVTAGSLSSIIVSPPSPSVVANGSQTFTALGYDLYSNMLNITPTWSIAAGQSAAGSINSSTGVFSAGHTAGTYSNAIIATSGSISGSDTVTVTSAAVSATQSTVNASPTSIMADGSTISTITVTLLDAYSNPVSGKTVTLTAGSGSSTITTVSGTSNSSGAATFTVKDSVAQSITYTAKDSTDAITITQTAVVNFVAVPIITTITPATGSIAGGNSVTITGSGFYGGGSSSVISAVTFGGANVTSYSVISDTSITVTTQSHASGAVNVVVTGTYGSANAAGGFTYGNITFRSVGANASGTATSLTISAPAGTIKNDVLIAFIYDQSTSNSQSTAPTGWKGQGYAYNSGQRFQVFTAVVGANNLTGSSWSFTGLTSHNQGVIIAYYNAASTGYGVLDPVTVSGRRNTSGTTGTTSITTTIANDMIIAAFASCSNGCTWSVQKCATAGTLTEKFDAAYSSFSSISVAQLLWSSFGATGVSSATMSQNTTNEGLLLALHP